MARGNYSRVFDYYTRDRLVLALTAASIHTLKSFLAKLNALVFLKYILDRLRSWMVSMEVDKT